MIIDAEIAVAIRAGVAYALLTISSAADCIPRESPPAFWPSSRAHIIHRDRGIPGVDDNSLVELPRLQLSSSPADPKGVVGL